MSVSYRCVSSERALSEQHLPGGSDKQRRIRSRVSIITTLWTRGRPDRTAELFQRFTKGVL